MKKKKIRKCCSVRVRHTGTDDLMQSSSSPYFQFSVFISPFLSFPLSYYLSVPPSIQPDCRNRKFFVLCKSCSSFIPSFVWMEAKRSTWFGFHRSLYNQVAKYVYTVRRKIERRDCLLFLEKTLHLKQRPWTMEQESEGKKNPGTEEKFWQPLVEISTKPFRFSGPLNIFHKKTKREIEKHILFIHSNLALLKGVWAEILPPSYTLYVQLSSSTFKTLCEGKMSPDLLLTRLLFFFFIRGWLVLHKESWHEHPHVRLQ